MMIDSGLLFGPPCISSCHLYHILMGRNTTLYGFAIS